MSLTVQPEEKRDAPVVTIGSQNEFEATLPLNPAEDFLATDQQRASIGRTALDRIMEENPTIRKLGWLGYGLLLTEIMKRTGINDAAASLVLFARRDELEAKTP